LLSELFLGRKMTSHQRKNFATFQDTSHHLLQVCLVYCLVAESVIQTILRADEEELLRRTAETEGGGTETEQQLKRNPAIKLLRATLTSAERNLTNIRNNHWAKAVIEAITSLSALLLPQQQKNLT